MKEKNEAFRGFYSPKKGLTLVKYKTAGTVNILVSTPSSNAEAWAEWVTASLNYMQENYEALKNDGIFEHSEIMGPYSNVKTLEE